jgi:hypothetical protein
VCLSPYFLDDKNVTVENVTIARAIDGVTDITITEMGISTTNKSLVILLKAEGADKSKFVDPINDNKIYATIL